MAGPVLLLTVLVIVATAGAAPTEYGQAEQLGCKDKPADIYFLLDCSSSVWIVDYDKQLEFVVSLIDRLHIADDATRVGLGIFSDTFYPVVGMGQYADKNTLIRQVRGTPYLSGNTYTGRGLNGMRTYGFGREVARDNVTKIGIVVTDGKSRHRSNTVAEARAAKESDIWLFAIGVGNDVDREELAAIASEPSDKFSFHVASFDILSTLVDTLALSTCSLDRPQADDGECGRSKKADVMFVYNAGGIANSDVKVIRTFIEAVAGKFSMTSGNVRTGIISDHEGLPNGDIDLDTYLRSKDFISAVSNQPRPSLSPLLKKLRLYGFEKGGRRDAVKMAVIFVDDDIESPNDAIYEALLLKYDGVVLHVIAVGNKYNEEHAKQLATSAKHLTKVLSYGNLQDGQMQRDFLAIFCENL